MAPKQILPPLSGDGFVFGVSPPEFVRLVDVTLGVAGAREDKWDQDLDVVASTLDVHQTALRAMSSRFQEVAQPWSDFLRPWEAPVGEALAIAATHGDAALSALEGLAIAAPPQSPIPGTVAARPTPGRPALPVPPRGAAAAVAASIVGGRALRPTHAAEQET